MGSAGVAVAPEVGVGVVEPVAVGVAVMDGGVGDSV
jgi:hypothetical protein